MPMKTARMADKMATPSSVVIVVAALSVLVELLTVSVSVTATSAEEFVIFGPVPRQASSVDVQTEASAGNDPNLAQ